MTAAVPLASTAHAQGFFNSWDQPAKPRKNPAKKTVAPVTSDKSQDKAKVVEAAPTGPLVISVSLAKQRLTVFDGSRAIAEAPISSGKVGHSTPTGIFTVLEKRRRHFSNLYNSAPMPNMQRITWSGVALHAGALPGYPASHGCIRLPHGFSQKLFGMTKNGTRVIVSRDPVSPKPFSHERLFRPYPPENELLVASAGNLSAGSMVAGVLGVGVAAAADGSIDPASLPYRERRRLEAERLTGEIRSAGYAKTAAWVELTAAAKAADAARQPYIDARTEIVRLTDAARAAMAKKKSVIGELDKLNLAIARKPELEDSEKTTAKRHELQDKVAEASDAADLADDAMKVAIENAKPLEAVALAAEAKRRAAVNAYSQATQALSVALASEEDIRRREAKRALPVSVFISRKTQRLYVRQGYTPMMEVPVTFERPDEAIGSHVFTALDVAPSQKEMVWSVVSVPSSGGKAEKAKQDKKRKGVEEVAVSADKPLTPAAALDRITIPQEARDYIEDVLKPGSSLIISDNGIGNETGQYTDFIVATR